MRRAALLFLSFAFCAAAAFGQCSVTNPYIQILTQPPLPGGYTGVNYSVNFSACTYQSGLSVVWSIVPGSGNLPPGLAFSTNTGNPVAVVGTPATTGTFTFTLSAQIANSQFPPSTAQFSISISKGSVTITSGPNLPTAIIGQSYQTALTATTNPPGAALNWSSNTALPPGLS